jgi:hypothetical protein
MSRRSPTKEEEEKYVLKLKEMSNKDLFEEALFLANATSMEEWDNMEEFEEKESRKELEKRLKEIGFYE